MKSHFYLLSLLLITQVYSVSKDDLIAEIKSKLSSMNNTMSFIIEGADGTVYVKEHLSSSGTEPYDDNTRIHIASGCKWPAMATIMKLVELEKIALDDKVTKYYPDFASSNPGLEIQHLMTHTSGYFIADDWIFDLDITLQQSVIGIAKGGKYPASTVNFQGGTQVGYSDIGMQIAGGIAEIVSGKSFQQLFEEYIATPLGMVNATFTAFDGVVATNIAVADGLLIRMIDYANFMRMLLNQGSFNGQTVLQSTTVATMLKDYTSDLPVDKDVMKDAVGSDVSESYSYAIGSWVYGTDANKKPTVFSSPGVHGYENWIDVENKYLCIFFLRTETTDEPVVSALSEAMRPDILSYYKSVVGTSYSWLFSILVILLIN